MQTIRDFVRGTGPEVLGGYRRGDSWVQTLGSHAECEKKIVVAGLGIGRDANGQVGDGILVRCWGCMLSWVIR